MIRRAVSTTLLSFLVLLAQGALAQLNYAPRSINIRAGVVILDSQQVSPGVPANYNPYVWYNLDSSRQIKPPGWNFHNPSAPGRVTQTILNRWSAINAAHTYGFSPVLDAPIGKKDAPYWEVFLSSATDEQLSQFDALSLSVQGYLSLNPDERGRLRRFVEAGGVLWVDVTSAAALDVINGLPMPFNVGNTNVGGALSADWFHPLLTFPGSISPSNLGAMQSERVIGLRTVDLQALGFGDLKDLQQSTEGDFARFYHVAADQLGPFLSVARVGDGFMVVTTRGVAYTLNRTQRLLSNQMPSGTYVPNDASTAEALVPDATTEAAAKLVVNMVHLVSGHPQFGGGAHKQNGGPIDVSAPLLQKFATPNGYDPGITNYVPPAVYKGYVAFTIGDQLWVYDADPARDADMDGNPDDGIQGYSFGQSWDLVWTSERGGLPGPVSPPTCAEVPNSSVVDQISVVDGNGRLCVFDLHSPGIKDVAPVFISGPPTPSTAPADPQRGPYAPTFYDGLYFISDDVAAGIAGTVGRVWVANASDGAMMTSVAPWAVGGAGVAQIQRPSAPVTVGDVPIQDGSGGTDRVVYIPTRGNALGGPQANAGITSLWFGAKGEKPTSWSEAGNQLVVVTRASLQGLQIKDPSNPPPGGDPLGVKLSVIDGNGNPLSAPLMNNLFTTGVSQASGVLTFTKRAGQFMPPNASIRVDYTIDWGTGNAGIQNQIIRGNVLLPDDNAHARLILDHITLSPTGMLYFVAANPNPDALGVDGGTYFAMQETGRGNFVLKDRFDLYPAHTVTLNQAAPISYAETLFDTDELTTFAPVFLTGSFTKLRFRSGPVVVGDTVYVTAAGYKFGGLVPCTIVMAFKANPETAEILVPEITGSFSIVQPDFARESLNKLKPVTFSVLQGGQFVYEGNQGNGRGRIRISSLSPNQRGLIQNSISRSQPVLIRRSGQPDILVEPDRTASNWSTLQWYAVFHGYDNASPPTVGGNTLYFAAKSMLPGILRGDPFPPGTTGLLLGMDSVISQSDAFLHDNPARPWLKQLWQIDMDNPVVGAVAPNPDIRMPQMRGVTSYEEWRQRLFQSTINSQNALGVVAGDGMLFTWGAGGLFGFSRADFVVADESRLARFDSSGNPLWTSDASATTGTALDSGAAGTIMPLVRPTRAYALNQRELMVVDTGADRIIQLDRNGREIRSISSFHLDPKFTPEGYATNAPLTLRQPRDVYVYTTYVKSPGQFQVFKPLEYWVHYLIADAGNHRLIELIDRYEADRNTRRIIGVIEDSPGVRALGVLNWHSPTTFSGGSFLYTGVSSIYDALTGAPRRVYVASIGGGLPTRVGLGLDSPAAAAATTSQEGNGGIIVFNDASGVIDAIEKIRIPDVAANAFWDPSTGTFNSAAEPSHYKKLSNVRSVNVKFNDMTAIGLGIRLTIMFADNDGVYEIYHDGTDWVVDWMLPKVAFKVMRRTVSGNIPTGSNPRDFLPTYARRLESGQVLVVNGYGGMTVGGAVYMGEVAEIDGTFDPTNDNTKFGFSFAKQNLGFSWFSVLFQLPPVSGARGIVIPVFADRR